MLLQKIKESAVIAVAVAVLIGALMMIASAAAVDAQSSDKVRICHRTSAVKNPYNSIEVDSNAVDGNLDNEQGNKPDHYGEHTGDVFDPEFEYPANAKNWGDIIPPVDGFHAGLNWTDEGKEIYNNDCSVPGYEDETNYCEPDDRPNGMSIAQWLNENQQVGSDCFEYATTDVCGTFDAQFTENQTGLAYSFRYMLGTETPELVDFMGDGELPVAFDEDANGGEQAVTYYAVGAEADYFVGFGIPNIWDGNGETVDVDTDCENPQDEEDDDNGQVLGDDDEREADQVSVTPASSVDAGGAAFAAVGATVSAAITGAGVAIKKYLA